MRGVLEDLRHAVRVLRRGRGFTAIAVLMLALGIGANTAIFSLVDAVLLRPLPVEELDRLFVIRESLPDLDLFDAQLAPPEVMDLAAREDVFDAVTGFQTGDRTLTGYGEPTRVSVASTLGDFFGVFGARPQAGRFYRPEQSIGGPREVAVVSQGLWQQLSGGEPSFLGTLLQLDGVSYEVIGVMPPAMRYPRQVQIWVPFAYTEQWQDPGARGRLFMTTVVRLRPGVDEAQLDAQLRAEASRWNEQYFRGSQFGKVLSAAGFVEYLAGPLRLVLLVLMGAVVFVLMIAAANVASLQLVRAAARAKEFAVRVAIGARRGRIARQLLMESLVLAVVGGAAGLWIGSLALALIERWEPARQMNLEGVALDGTVLGFTALAALLAALASGLIPALGVLRVDPQDVLRDAARGTSAGPARQRLLEAGIVLQVALSLLLVLGSGLMLRTLARLLATDPGFVSENVTTAQVSILGGSDTPQRVAGFYDPLLDRLRALPGVQDAALVWGLPLTQDGSSSPFEIIGRVARPDEPAYHAEARFVSAGYFRTMGIPLLRGRDFTTADRQGVETVSVIDRTFAEQFFPNENPIGERISHFIGESTIVGVVERVHHDEIGDPPKALAYYSFGYAPWISSRTIVVRGTEPVGTVAGMLRTIVAELDPSAPVYDVQTMDGRIERSLGARRLAMLALAGFGALSLLLAALGIYGVMRYTTSMRTHEIGIRLAIGAQTRDVTAMIMRRGMATAALGVVLGTLASFALTRLLRGILFGVSPQDPITFIAATLLLAAVASLACWLPAHRATRVDPMEVLRTE